jgi:hypothetical protein
MVGRIDIFEGQKIMQMKKILSSFSVIFLMSVNVCGQNIPVDPSVKIGTLSNGMKYYIKKMFYLRKR